VLVTADILVMDRPGIFNMKRNTIGLFVWGALLIISAISGISSCWTSDQGVSITYYHNILLRGLVAIVGIFLFYVGWSISKRRRWGWRTYFVVQILAWLTFVSLATSEVAANYPKETSTNILLFAGLLALVSLPVAIYWGIHWHKQKEHFESGNQ
jgi:hypothetical protein